jgi:hypothetical protein
MAPSFRMSPLIPPWLRVPVVTGLAVWPEGFEPPPYYFNGPVLQTGSTTRI